jgi:hypothetical protein
LAFWNTQLSITTNGFLKIQNFLLPRPRQLLVGAVCALNGKYSSFKEFPEGASPSCTGLTPEALANRKVVCREACTEVSETAKAGTDEQKLHTRLYPAG